MLSDQNDKNRSVKNIMSANPTRQHSLSISCSVMDDKTFLTENSNIEIYEACFSSPFGDIIALGTEQGLIGLGFANEIGHLAARQELVKKWGQVRFRIWPERLESWVNAVLTGKGHIEMHIVGTKFQTIVWQALMHIPSGDITTYSEIAEFINHPRAVRAVGTAIGQNPLGFIIPCHRVLRKSGGLGGYRWGVKLKRAMLVYEGSHKGQI